MLTQSVDTMAAVAAVDLVKVYGSGDTAVRALDGVTVGFDRAQFTAIMGPSGSGKSTLMHCLAGLDTATSGQALLGGTPSTNAALYQASSPINFVSARCPPTLILHGGADPLVPVSQSTALKATLESVNVPVQMVIYPTEGHGWLGANLSDSYGKIADFLKTYNP